MTNKRLVLVTGATGKQGGAVVEALLQRGHQVRATTRNPDSKAATNLKLKGVDVVKADFSDSASLLKAATGVDTLYAMMTPLEAGIEAEVQQGIALADAAKAAGVGHLILGSVASADGGTGIPHFDSKYRVEQYVAALGVPYTISAPVFFMENLIDVWALPSLREGKLALAMPSNRPLQQIAVRDIGRFVVAMVERRQEVFGKRFDIGGDEITGEEAAAILSRVTGREIRYEGFPPEYLQEQSEDMALMFKWFDAHGYVADIQALHRDFSEVHWLGFEDWAKVQDWSILTIDA
jgi:uncharacterized protein YbjT (DUF2867 family)